MTLIFIENRHKTFFFDAIAEKLQRDYDIHWIIQNPRFQPKTGTSHRISFPKHKNYSKNSAPQIDYDKVISSDRQLNFFEKNDSSYFYYYASEIDAILKRVNPSAVFGESTAFHELLTIELCKKRAIQYLNPSTCRYPSGRFSFYENDTLEPYKGSGDSINPEKAKQIISAITNRSVQPDYMKRITANSSKKIKDKAKLIASYYQGETYNTPSPLVKYSKERIKKQLILEWDSISEHNVSGSGLRVLYPLQMQPEANIDVWGRRHRDQLATVKLIHSQLENNAVLYVKPNPKSKYEISEALLAFIKDTPQVVALAHKVSMADIISDLDIVVTVTGTIAIECILSNKPVITLIETIHNNASNCIYAENSSVLRNAFQRVQNNTFPALSEPQHIEFLNTLNKTSYKGIVSDPFTDENCVNKENLESLVSAFNNILS